MSKLCEVIGGRPKQSFVVNKLYVGDASLQCFGPSDWVWLRLEIKQNHWSILKKSCILYQFRADVQMYSYQPQYTADSDAVDTDMCNQKCQVAATSVIREMRSSSE